jgi:DNA-directed RNA polymerase subunit RPC12/RpoP
MKCTLNVVSKPSFLPLRDAVLCKDCEFISADEGDVCSVCGSRSLLRLRELVKSSAESASVTASDIFQFFGMRLGETA